MLEQDVANLIEPPLTEMGYRLVRIQLMGARHRPILQIMAERLDEITMGIEDCTAISKHLSVLLDVAEFLQTPYRLEVSSPGVDRPLITLDDFYHHRGLWCSLLLKESSERGRRLKGKVLAINTVKPIDRAMPVAQREAGQREMRLEEAGQRKGDQTEWGQGEQQAILSFQLAPPDYKDGSHSAKQKHKGGKRAKHGKANQFKDDKENQGGSEGVKQGGANEQMGEIINIAFDNILSAKLILTDELLEKAAAGLLKGQKPKPNAP